MKKKNLRKSYGPADALSKARKIYEKTRARLARASDALAQGGDMAPTPDVVAAVEALRSAATQIERIRSSERQSGGEIKDVVSRGVLDFDEARAEVVARIARFRNGAGD